MTVEYTTERRGGGGKGPWFVAVATVRNHRKWGDVLPYYINPGGGWTNVAQGAIGLGKRFRSEGNALKAARKLGCPLPGNFVEVPAPSDGYSSAVYDPETEYDAARWKDGSWAVLRDRRKRRLVVGKKVVDGVVVLVDDCGLRREFRKYKTAYYAAARADADDWLRGRGVR